MRVWRCYMRLLTYLLIDNKLVIETDCSFKMSLAMHNTLNTQSDTRHLWKPSAVAHWWWHECQKIPIKTFKWDQHWSQMGNGRLPTAHMGTYVQTNFWPWAPLWAHMGNHIMGPIVEPYNCKHISCRLAYLSPCCIGQIVHLWKPSAVAQCYYCSWFWCHYSTLIEGKQDFQLTHPSFAKIIQD